MNTDHITGPANYICITVKQMEIRQCVIRSACCWGFLLFHNWCQLSRGSFNCLTHVRIQKLWWLDQTTSVLGVKESSLCSHLFKAVHLWSNHSSCILIPGLNSSSVRLLKIQVSKSPFFDFTRKHCSDIMQVYRVSIHLLELSLIKQYHHTRLL